MITELLFGTILLWILFILILWSNPRLTLNRICFVGGMFFSLGLLKEYLYYDFIPFLNENGVSYTQMDFQNIYSFMTSLLYLCAMPCAFLFAVELQINTEKKLYSWKVIAPFLLIPLLCFILVFSPWDTYELQRTSFSFWVSISLYNVIYGILFTILSVRSVRQEPNQFIRKQKFSTLLIFLPLIWFWLITIFVFHTLQLVTLLTFWKYGSTIVFALIVCYLFFAFKSGMMGIRLKFDHYYWQSDEQTVFKGAQFISHALKHDLTKLHWCVDKLAVEQPESPEIKIMTNALSHLQEMQQTILVQTGILKITKNKHAFSEILEVCNLDFYQKLNVNFLLPQEEFHLYCDLHHTAELLKNLFSNALEATDDSCEISITHQSYKRVKSLKGYYNILRIKDNGRGFSSNEKESAFKPYYSNKTATNHLGLGLFYCARVMEAHGGLILLEKTSNLGTTFALAFPTTRKE